MGFLERTAEACSASHDIAGVIAFVAVLAVFCFIMWLAVSEPLWVLLVPIVLGLVIAIFLTEPRAPKRHGRPRGHQPTEYTSPPKNPPPPVKDGRIGIPDK